MAVIAGDGIGKEVIPAGCNILAAAAETAGSLTLQLHPFPWGSDYYQEHGTMMPPDALEVLAGYDAIYLGAVGWPSIAPDHVTLWGLLLPIRKEFNQYINVRPIRLLPGLQGVLRNKGPEAIDFVVIREKSEGEYAGIGGRHNRSSPEEVALQTAVFTRRAVERVMRFSFELVRKRRSKVTCVTKSNACQYSMVLWDEVFWELAAAYPDVEVEQWHVDAMSVRFLLHPETLDVVVASNLIGDILSDLGGGLMGSLGLPPSANINPEQEWPSMFEAVHGSAPDIAGHGIANPIATAWAGAMMLDFLGEVEAGKLAMQAIEGVVRERTHLSRDLGGRSSCQEVGEPICRQIRTTG